MINGIMNEVHESKKCKIDIQIVDIKKCFDKMSYKETGNDLFNAGVRNDHFVLMANSKKKCQVAVRTPWGSVTDRVELSEIEMQGQSQPHLNVPSRLTHLGRSVLSLGNVCINTKNVWTFLHWQ